jgi:hypothetical protein
MGSKADNATLIGDSRETVLVTARLLSQACIAISGEPAQRGLVANKPDVPERVDESSLPMNAPGRLVVPNPVAIAARPLLHRPGNEGVRILAEHLHPRRCDAEHGWALPAVRLRLSDEERRAPATSIPATDPRLHSSVAPSARLHHATAAGASGTASMTEMSVPRVSAAIVVAYRSKWSW